MQTEAAQVPDGMRQVTKAEFFAILYADKRCIMPVSRPYDTRWETRDRELVGWSSPGWKCIGEKTWAWRG